MELELRPLISERLSTFQIHHHSPPLISASLINPGERFVIAANDEAFAARYPGVAIHGDYTGRLSNTGEWITLVDAEGNVIDSFRYNDNAPFPTEADGNGPSLVRNDPASDLDPTLGEN